VEATEVQQKLQRGLQNVTFSSQATVSVVVPFPVACTGQLTAPSVVATCHDANTFCAVSLVSNTQFTLTATRRDGVNWTGTPACEWIAVG
jgi:hypothetical protein